MRLWLGLSGLLVFAAGCVVGILVFRKLGPAPEATGLSIRAMYTELPPYLVTSEEVYRELDLDGPQKEQIDLLLADHYRRVREVRASFQDLAADLRDGVDKVLRPEQREKFEVIQQRYNEREIQSGVAHELLNLRTELSLTPEQEPRVFQILYDAASESREVWRSHPRGTDRREAHKKWSEVSDRRDVRLKDILTLEQQVKYQERREREKRLWSERKERGEKRSEKQGPPPRAPDSRRGEDSKPTEETPKPIGETPKPIGETHPPGSLRQERIPSIVVNWTESQDDSGPRAALSPCQRGRSVPSSSP